MAVFVHVDFKAALDSVYFGVIQHQQLERVLVDGRNNIFDENSEILNIKLTIACWLIE